MRILTIILITLLVCSSIQSQNKFYSVKGKEFVTPDGKTVQLKGINLGNWLVPEGYMFLFSKTSAPRMIYGLLNELIGPTEAAEFWNSYRDRYITREDIHFIKQCGFNSIRIPFHYQFFISLDNPEVEINTGITLLKRVTEWCTAEGLGVVFDMHCAPGGQTGDNIDDSYGYPFLFESESAQQAAITVWLKIAKEFKDDPTVIGYDLINEPIAHYFDASKLNPLLEPFFKRTVAELRKIDTNHIMFIGGAQWNSNFKVFGPPFDKKSVYTFHKYWTPSDKSVIQEYLDYSDKYNVPLWMGESGENTDEWITEFTKTLNDNAVSWCYWPYKKMDSPRGPVSIKQPNGYNIIKTYAEGDRVSYDDLRKNRPDAKIVRKILDEYLENILLKNCTVNPGYLNALGMKVPQK